jgi:hypothetical protein
MNIIPNTSAGPVVYHQGERYADLCPVWWPGSARHLIPNLGAVTMCGIGLGDPVGGAPSVDLFIGDEPARKCGHCRRVTDDPRVWA